MVRVEFITINKGSLLIRLLFFFSPFSFSEEFPNQGLSLDHSSESAGS